MPKATFPNGKTREYPDGTLVSDIVRDVCGDNVCAVAARINDHLVDLNSPFHTDASISLIDFDSPEGLEILRHSTSHVMAQAVRRLYPGVKLAIGPSIEGGFYYDFDLEQPLTDEDLGKIEKEMSKIISESLPIRRVQMEKDDALAKMRETDEPYKIELIEALDDSTISFYEQDDFIDLCRGPHLSNTSECKAFKLLSVAGAYWRGDENNKMLQRIYGTAFPDQKQLDEHLRLLEEAKKRDHRKLGRDLDLFSFHQEGPGFAFFHPKGMVVWNTLIDFWRQVHTERGYGEVRTPIMLRQHLWEESGHWDHFRENMYFTEVDDNDYAIKPMNCPGGMLIYKSKLHSYRDLPLRWGELGLVHRHERSGVLHGLIRVRQFTQDDAHIFMLPEQMIEEIVGVIDLVEYFYSVFGLPFFVELSTRPEGSIGTDEMWEQATDALKQALAQKGLDYKLSPRDGAFYGPKIDFHVRDALNRTHQCATIQLDFAEPEQFDLTYVAPDGREKRPVMIHRTVMGSIERFLGILIEHFGGALPTWLAPVQVKVLPIADQHHEYARNVQNALQTKGIRCECDLRNEKVGFKIREATKEKVPYMLIVGAKEIEANTVAVRHRTDGDHGAQDLDEFLKTALQEIENRK